MSAEGKKKRGESGRKNAEDNPFRMNGLPMDWQYRRLSGGGVGASVSGGSTFMRGFLGGIIVENIGHGTAHATEARLYHAQKRCTHHMLRE